jgi:hypothetical protein
MLNKIKIFGLSMILASSLMFTGCSSTAELNETLTPIENRFDDVINEMDINIENLDEVALKENVEECDLLLDELIAERAEYKPESDEYKLFSEFISVVKYTKEIIEMGVDLAENPLGAIFEVGIIEEKANTYKDKYSEALENYIEYKEKLGLNPYITDKGDESKKDDDVEENKDVDKKEENVKESKQQEKTVEEKDKVIEEKYCDWCGAKAGHSTDEHEAQCYDCGEVKNVKEMEYNGRSFHCGCIDQEPAEDLWVCPGCDGNYPENEMLEDTENGIWYCYGCYNEIMYYRMDGDANGDLEEWEY